MQPSLLSKICIGYKPFIGFGYFRLRVLYPLYPRVPGYPKASLYGYLIQKKGLQVPINDPQVPDHNGTYFFKNAVLDMKLKSNLVFWAVSHCQTYSQRELYVEILKKYIPVDIFGKCGPLQCPENGTRWRSP